MIPAYRRKRPGWRSKPLAQEAEVPPETAANPLLVALRNSILTAAQRPGPDLSARHLGLFLTVYLVGGRHTVASLSKALDLSKASVCRALDKLDKHGLARRKLMPLDQRVVFVQRTPKGVEWLRSIETAATDGGQQMGNKAVSVAATEAAA